MSQPIFFALYQLLQQYIYGLDTVLTPDMELTLTLLATSGSVFAVMFPILLIWKAFR